MPDAASAGLLAPANDVGIDTTGFDANLAGPGTVDGVTYGVPIGANTLGLYYNKDILDKAGVDPASITDWASLDGALAKVNAAGYKGITFSGIAGEEGVFQFLPWFWGAGANLKDLGSDQAIAAATLLSDWIGKGYAPKSALTDNQSRLLGPLPDRQVRVRRERLVVRAGRLAAEGLQGGRDAAARQGRSEPLRSRPAASSSSRRCRRTTPRRTTPTPPQVIDCLVGTDNQVKTADALGYFAANKDLRASRSPPTRSGRRGLQSIESAQGRTTDLGAGLHRYLGQAVDGAAGSAERGRRPAARSQDAFEGRRQAEHCGAVPGSCRGRPAASTRR